MKTRKLTRLALITALICAVLYISALLPSGRLALVAVAGIFTAAAVVSYGVTSAFAVFAVSAALGAVIVPDKGNVLMFVAFFGYYPIVKSLLEKPESAGMRWILKLILVNVVFAVLWFAAKELLLLELDAAYPVAVTHAVVNVVFVVYDIGLTKLITFYICRLAKYMDRDGRGI